jgi:hypothetical protein
MLKMKSLNGNVLFEKLPKYYKLTAGINELGRNFVLNRRLVNGNTQEFIQGIENVNHGYNGFATQFKNILM